MRLSKIKLSGFKSFVDPTTVHLTSNLVGVVGPNGSGKSNIIDAVRWVMGESSAKHLRGGSMADVIFNGSSSRKPVGQASIELVFDNSIDGLGGQFANYNEISVKRLVSRDGQSNYYLNGTKCRRRDITDIFLGTGLGPRSYAIIEQGMIARMIEAKPEDLRVTIEEAAGISKYKERRRETENRIRHTQENLSRIADLRDELGKQIEKLQRQAKTAERYKHLKADERTFQGQYLALQWQEFDLRVKDKSTELSRLQTQLEATMATLRSLEVSIEKQRESHIESSELLAEIQAQFYQVGAEISSNEQLTQHHKERQQQIANDLQQVSLAWEDALKLFHTDEQRLADLTQKTAELEPQYAAANEVYELSKVAQEETENALQNWQAEWDQFNATANQPTQIAEVERTKITHLEEQSQQLEKRFIRLQGEAETIATGNLEQELDVLNVQIGERQNEIDNQLGALQENQARITEQRQQNHTTAESLSQIHGDLQKTNGRMASLEALQEDTFGKRDEKLAAWLSQQGLTNATRLAEVLDVDDTWEKALETVLGQHLQAICVNDIADVSAALGTFSAATISFVEQQEPVTQHLDSKTLLIHKVKHKFSAVDNLLANIHCAQDLEQALTLRQQLGEGQSVITKEGVWLGRNWLTMNTGLGNEAGVLGREKELKSLASAGQQCMAQKEILEAQLDHGKQVLQEIEIQRDLFQDNISQLERNLGESKSQRSGRQARLDHLSTRKHSIVKEQLEIQDQISAHRTTVQLARGKLELALEQMEALNLRREALSAIRDELRAATTSAKDRANTDRQNVQNLQVELQATKTALEGTQQNIKRIQQQLDSLGERKLSLETQNQQDGNPLTLLHQELEKLLARKLEIESHLQQARNKVAAIDAEIRELSERKIKTEHTVEQTREVLEQSKLDAQTHKVKQQGVQDRITESGHDLSVIFESMPADATLEAWQENINEIELKISRLGAINLAAIDEYVEQQARLSYLDAQNQDLVDALEILDNAIRKMDRETRAKFKDTFDFVNNGLKRMFPKLFGGGQAYLELTGEDLLDTGVTIMARPPGKRITNIHQLSGGEKALTAVALVFAIFELNPAPFCMLDEVDAPLDEANVGRFCELLKTMSEKVQFIFITHNKATMEISEHLNGVTMHEPGVSRMVTVDVEEATQLVAV